ncbi:MAG: 1-acyl-sn-glycerol-3-phosphate acyltransferase [Planctomycetes bacterium]|nr:1-acyl-sn-glycerol-3-phosphate acyltransferase [Planctomycetota bacterium]
MPASETPSARGEAAADDPHDPVYSAHFFGRAGWLLRRIFRLEVEGLERIDRDRPGVLVINHNSGLWGLLDICAVYYAWHHLQAAPGPLSSMGERLVAQAPLLGGLFRRAGIYHGTPASLESVARRGHWVLVSPGGNVDMGRPIWRRNRVRFQKPFWIKGRRYFRDQLWYLQPVLDCGMPLYPVAISGTHEMTPILWESPRLYRWLGLKKLRGDEFWGGYPITINHLLNLAIFLATPLRSSLLAWIVFLLANTYFDPMLSYPLILPRVRIRIGEPIPELGYSSATTHMGREAALRATHQRLEAAVNSMLVDLDRKRWWSRLLGRGRPPSSSPGPEPIPATPDRGPPGDAPAP